MDNKNRESLAKYRIESAKEKCEAADMLLREDKCKDAANRAYYAFFHAMRAVLAIEAIDFKKHSSVIAHFRQYYIKTGKFDIVFSKMIGEASLIRNQSDYEDFFVVIKEDAKQQCENAKLFCATVEKYLQDMFK